jgi:hypothetical protein
MTPASASRAGCIRLSCCANAPRLDSVSSPPYPPEVLPALVAHLPADRERLGLPHSAEGSAGVNGGEGDGLRPPAWIGAVRDEAVDEPVVEVPRVDELVA